jgi:hypothetical protein
MTQKTQIRLLGSAAILLCVIALCMLVAESPDSPLPQPSPNPPPIWPDPRPQPRPPYTPEPFVPIYAKGLIHAGQRFPGAQVCDSELHPLLVKLAGDHAEYQALHRTQGHQLFPARFERIRAAGLGSATEICAESWPWQTFASPDELGMEMFASWQKSPGHWAVASSRHRYYGVGISRGKDGVWYACIIAAD